MSGRVDGFAAFDPDEKDHHLENVKCDVVLKDSFGDVVSKVDPYLLVDEQSVITFKVEGMEMHNMRA
jgi:hypothetical protein